MKTKGFNRREFLKLSSIALAGGYAGLHSTVAAAGRMGGGGMGGPRMGGGGVVDPPVGGLFADPPVLRGIPGNEDMLGAYTLYSVEATESSVTVDGASAKVLTYLDRHDPAAALQTAFVCPTIVASPNERIRLQFRNSLQLGGTNLLGHVRDVTNMHVHGLHVSPEYDAMSGLPADNVHDVILSRGDSAVYDYDLRYQRPGSMALYHPHVHGTVAEQFWGGLVGAIDVRDDLSFPELAPYARNLLLLKDVTLSGGEPEPYTMLSEYMRGKEGNVVTVNGIVNPLLQVYPGDVRRFRILNVSNARFYRLSIEGHALHVIGADGGLLDRPYEQGEILLAPGERVDVLVKMTTTRGVYKLLSLPYARHGNMASAQTTLATLEVTKSAPGSVKPLPGLDNTEAVRISDDLSLPRPRFTLSMGQGRGYINGIPFEVLADGSIRSFEHHSMAGTDEVWEIVNNSGMDHPWHQHVNDAQVLSITGGDATFAKYAQFYGRVPAWKDTIIIPKWGTVRLRIPIRDFDGMTMFHCHILEHEDIGMMGMWHIMGDGMPMGG
ncbi:MAG: multicopper oxidase family protein [Deltaproteobacteria bacterium]|nr:multicopper oxidase family protein [Candidatus Deferrimicrobiaceae bacterium]